MFAGGEREIAPFALLIRDVGSGDWAFEKAACKSFYSPSPVRRKLFRMGNSAFKATYLVALMYRRLSVLAPQSRKLLSKPLYRADAAVAAAARKDGRQITAI